MAVVGWIAVLILLAVATIGYVMVGVDTAHRVMSDRDFAFPLALLGVVAYLLWPVVRVWWWARDRETTRTILRDIRDDQRKAQFAAGTRSRRNG